MSPTQPTGPPPEDPVTTARRRLTQRPTIDTGAAPSSVRQVAEPPRLALPPGGGAVRSMGERMSEVGMRGTCSVTVPVTVPQGRTPATTPDLTLGYSTAGGQSDFGLGWHLGPASVQRRTDRGLPTYDDERDRFLLGGTDLVALDRPNVVAPAPFAGTGTPTVRWLYLPRVAEPLVRVERHEGPDGVFWAVFTPDDVLTVYGRTSQARVADPQYPARIFEWLAEDVYDAHGNHLHYRYLQEDEGDVPVRLRSEDGRQGRRTPARHLKEVCYANRTPIADRGREPPVDHDAADWRADFCYVAVLDYGDHSVSMPDPDQTWQPREDPFSTRRPGFEIRSHRRCERILLFHQFPDQLGEPATLVAETLLGYQDPTTSALLRTVSLRHHGPGAEVAELAPVTFTYAPWEPAIQPEALPLAGLEALPVGALSPAQLVDLEGWGAPGVLTPAPDSWHYAANRGDATFVRSRTVPALPGFEGIESGAPPALGALFGDHRTTLLTEVAGTRSYSVQQPETQTWTAPRAFPSQPVIDWSDPRVRHVDLTGDGLPDLVRLLTESIEWYPFLGEEGWAATRRALLGDERSGPAVVLAAPSSVVLVADMTGDGLSDLVRVTPGGVDYWPSLGFGRFGARIAMAGAPLLDARDDFDPARVHLVDVDGSGTADLLYQDSDRLLLWPNHHGNRYGDGVEISGLPTPHPGSALTFADLMGKGTSCAVVSSSLPGRTHASLLYADLMAGGKPRLLQGIDNGNGARTTLTYSTSTQMALADARDGQPWLTRLPVCVHVVRSCERADDVTGVRSTTSYWYRDGLYDVADREFRGFGYVEVSSSDLLAPLGADAEGAQTDTEVRCTWFHTGTTPRHVPARLVDDVFTPDGDPAVRRELMRSLHGKVLREAVYGFDGTAASTHPYQVTEHSWTSGRLTALGEISRDPDQMTASLVMPRETVTLTLERSGARPELGFSRVAVLRSLPPQAAPASADPPRVVHEAAVEVDGLGHVRRSVTVAYARTDAAARGPQRTSLVTSADIEVGHDVAAAGSFRCHVPLAESSFQIHAQVTPGATGLVPFADLAGLAAATVVPHEHEPQPGGPPVRRWLSASSHRYWDDDFHQELPAGSMGRLAMPRRNLTAALTQAQVAHLADGIPAADLTAEGRYESAAGPDGTPVLWAPSATAHYGDAARFHLPAAYVDPFGLGTFVDYDVDHLLPVAVVTAPAVAAVGDGPPTATQPAWHTTTAAYDYRSLQPQTLTDPHGHVDTAEYDAFGVLRRSRRRGAQGEGVADGSWDIEVEHQPRAWYDSAPDARQPNWMRRRIRETADQDSRWTSHRTHFDGTGAAAQEKVQADPAGGQARWLSTADTVYDQRARPVQKFEPYFATSDDFERDHALTRTGLPNTVGYDPLSRVDRIDFADGTVVRVEHGAWRSRSWDQNDSVRGSRWETEQLALGGVAAQAAQASAQHADTPSTVHCDVLGRTAEVVELNGGRELVTTIELDVEGRTVQITGPGGAVVEHADVDLLGRALVKRSADAGERRTVADVAGRDLRSWRGCHDWGQPGAGFEVRVREERDSWGRTRSTWVLDTVSGDPVERCRYVAGYGDDDLDYGKARYLLGSAHQVFDGSGVESIETRDFHDHPTQVSRQFAVAALPEWGAVAGAAPAADLRPAAPGALEADVSTVHSAFDLLGRVVSNTAAEGSTCDYVYGDGGKIAAIGLTPSGEARREVLVDVSYDQRGRTVRVVQAGTGGAVCDTTSTYRADNGRLVSMRVSRKTAPGDVLQDLRYTYDAAGNVLRIDDAAQTTAFYKNTVVPAARTFGYDDLYQLVSAEGRELVGLTHTSAGSSLTPPAQPLPSANDLKAVVRYSESYTYDDAGNLVALDHTQHVAGG